MKWVELLEDGMGRRAGERLAVSEADGQPLVSAAFALSRGAIAHPAGTGGPQPSQRIRRHLTDCDR